MITDEELHRKLHGLNQFISGTSECEDYLFTYQELKDMVSELIQRREEKRYSGTKYLLLRDEYVGPFDEQEMANYIFYNCDSDIECVLCTMKLPNRYMRVGLTVGEDQEVQYEWVDRP
jgi:hypothetical protein